MGESSSYRVAGIAIILCLVIAGFITLITSTPQNHDELTKQSQTVTSPSVSLTQGEPVNQSAATSRMRVLWYDDAGKTYTFHDYPSLKGAGPGTWKDADLPSPENGTSQRKAAMVRFLEWDGSIERMTGTKYLIDQDTITGILNSYTLIAPPPVIQTPEVSETPSIQPTPDVTPAPGMLIPTCSRPCNMGDGTIRVSFGYINRHNGPVSLPIGDRNFFSPGDPDRGQPTSFQPGIHQDIFTVRIIENGTNIAWYLMNTMVGAGQVPRVQAGLTADPAIGYAPLDIRFSDQSHGGTTDDPLTGSWNFGDGTSAEGTSTFHRYELPGKYESSRIVSTTCGSETAKKIITVNQVSFTAEPVPDMPHTYSFRDQSTGEPAAWAWDFNDGFSSWEQNPVHTWRSPGTYLVGLTVSGKSGSGTTVQRITVQ